MEHPKKNRCCATSSIINFCGKCLCLRAPEYSKIKSKQREKAEREAERDLLAANLFYKDAKKPSPRRNKLKVISSARLVLHLVHRDSSHPAESAHLHKLYSPAEDRKP